MSKIIKTEDGMVSVRLDGAYISNGKHLVEPYIKPGDEKEQKRYFGNFKFHDPEAIKILLEKAVQESDYEDTVFYGPYPNWIEDNYGQSLAVGNRVKFYKSIRTKDLVPNEEIQEYIYALEIHLKKTKENGIFLAVARAVATAENEYYGYQDELFEDIEELEEDEEVDIFGEEPDPQDLPF